MSRRQSLHRKVVIKEGFLTRAPAGKLAVLKSWERRWFVFGTLGSYPYLECYTDSQAVLTGSTLDFIDLSNCQQIVTKMITVDGRHPHCFNLILSDRILCLAADSRNEMVAWCKTLQKKLEELGCFTAAQENVYEEHQQLSRLRQVVRQEDQQQQLGASAASAVEQLEVVAAVTRRPRAVTPVSAVADDAWSAQVAAVGRPTVSLLVENDFAPLRRSTAVDSEARINFGRLLAVCGQGACEATGGSCSCSSCSNLTGGEAQALPTSQAAAALSAVLPPAAVPRRPAAKSAAVGSASAASAASLVASLSLDPTSGLTAPRHSSSIPESGFRPIEAAPPRPFADEAVATSSSSHFALPVARPVALSGPAAAAVAERASLAASDCPLPSAAGGGSQSLAVGAAAAQRPKQPPVARARAPPQQQPAQRSECDFFVHSHQLLPAGADPDERVGASSAGADWSPARPPPLLPLPQQRLVSWEQSPAMLLVPPPLPPVIEAWGDGGDDLEDDDDGTDLYETVAGRACAASAGGSGADGAALAPGWMFELERQDAGAAEENEYGILLSSADRVCQTASPSVPAHFVSSSSSAAPAAAGDRTDLHSAKPAFDVCAKVIVAAPQQQLPQAKTALSVSSVDNRPEASRETGSNMATDYVNWSVARASAAPQVEASLREQPLTRAALEDAPVARAARMRVATGAAVEAASPACSACSASASMQRARSSPRRCSSSSEPAPVERLLAREESPPDEEDDDMYSDALAYQLIDSRAADARSRAGGGAAATGEQLSAHVGTRGHGSYSEAMATSPEAGGSKLPARPAAAVSSVATTAVAATSSVAEYARLVRQPRQQQQASSKPNVHLAEPPRRPAGVAASASAASAPPLPPQSVSVDRLIVEAAEYFDWTGSNHVATPPLPQRLRTQPAGGVSNGGAQQLREDRGPSPGNGRRRRSCSDGGSSSSGDDVSLQLPVRVSRPSRAMPKSGGTLMLGGALLKMPTSCPSTNGEGHGHQPIRQSQVEELLSEINNIGGVKVSAYKKEVAGNICFVEVDGKVWVAGWNQKSQPLLQKLLHVGDEVLSLNHESVTSCAALAKSIRMGDNDRKLTFVLRRLPLATVLSIRRRFEGEDVGIRCMTGTPEVDVVVPGGLAHASGLKPRAASSESMRQCNWFLTEINGRPVSLFFKNAEVDPRLSAVGKDVTLVLQPSDFVAKLKKQLKCHWGYKSYIVQ